MGLSPCPCASSRLCAAHTLPHAVPACARARRDACRTRPRARGQRAHAAHQPVVLAHARAGLAVYLAPTARVELYFFLAWSYHRSAKGFTNLLVWLTVNDTALLAPLAPKCCRSERARDAAAAAADDAAAGMGARNVAVGGGGGGSARQPPTAETPTRDSTLSIASAAPPDADVTVRARGRQARQRPGWRTA